MELLLPRKASTEKIYKHFLVESTPTEEAVKLKSKRIDFFYIGRISSRIDFLVKSFEEGYVLENAEIAISFLKRSAEEGVVPGIIIVNGQTDEMSLRKLNHFLLSDSRFAAIPLMLDGAELSESELGQCRKMRAIDEIVFLNRISKEKLIAKADFLRKIKANSTYFSSEKQVKTPPKTELSITLFLKRLFDILASGLAILILSPVLLVVALLVHLESKGPVFYISKRAGKGYKIFNFYKFRTMVADADKKVSQLAHLNQYTSSATEGPTFFKISNDPRITKIGAFLRNTSLDELPQLLNVFLGDMSLVGNRPLPLYEAASLTTDEHAMRFMAPAGITGLWQIKKRGDSNMSVEERISLDIDYAKKISFVYDLWIIVRTPTALLQKENV